jgi:hypothetical protein
MSRAIPDSQNASETQQLEPIPDPTDPGDSSGLDDDNSDSDPGDDDSNIPLGNAGNDPSPPSSDHGEDTPRVTTRAAMVAPATVPITQFMEMQKAFVASMNQIADLTSQLANGPPATRSQPTKEFKPKDPNTFKGRSWQELETFLFDCKEHFKARPLTLATEDQQQSFAVSFLSEKVKTTWLAKLRFGTSDNWETLTQFLEKYVKPLADHGQNAAYQILIERQNGQRIHDWYTRCVRLWDTLKEETTQAQLFIITLDLDIQREITRASTPPKTLQEAGELAV